MTAKEQLHVELTNLGVKFDKRLGESKLQELLTTTKAKFEAIQDDITGATKMTTDDLTQGERTEDGIKRKSGLIIPNKVVAQLQKTRWVYFSEDTSEKSIVAKEYGKHVQYVREYTRQIHGPDFQKLAHQFVDKNNLRK